MTSMNFSKYPVDNRVESEKNGENPFVDEETTATNQQHVSVPEPVMGSEPDATSEEIKAELADRPLPPMLDQADLERAKDRVFGAGKTNTNRNRMTKLNHKLAIKEDDWNPERELEKLNKGRNPEDVSSEKLARLRAKKIFREKILPLGRKMPKDQARVEHFLASAKNNPKLKTVHYKAN